jgi:hypothetical protein
MLASPGSILRTGPSTTAHYVRASNVRPWASLPETFTSLWTKELCMSLHCPIGWPMDGSAPAENVLSERTMFANYAAAGSELRLPSILFPIHD